MFGMCRTRPCSTARCMVEFDCGRNCLKVVKYVVAVVRFATGSKRGLESRMSCAVLIFGVDLSRCPLGGAEGLRTGCVWDRWRRAEELFDALDAVASKALPTSEAAPPADSTQSQPAPFPRSQLPGGPGMSSAGSDALRRRRRCRAHRPARSRMVSMCPRRVLSGPGGMGAEGFATRLEPPSLRMSCPRGSLGRRWGDIRGAVLRRTARCQGRASTLRHL